jgi:pyruvate dehydrogenase E2 component (dihydrolipoamide acetyltransferase)
LAKQAAAAPSSPPESKEVETTKKADTAPPPSSKEPEAAKPKASQESADLPVGQRIFASPIAKKIALEKGIPLAKVKGTGPSGRIIREDVENYKTAPVVASSTLPTTAQPPAATLPPDYVDTPISNMRRTIGTRLTQSKQEIPHYYLTVDIAMDKVLKLREVFNKTLSEKDQKLSVNDFIVKAVACALVDVPEANSAWLGEVIRT